MCLGEFFSTLFSFFSGMHRLGGGFLGSFILFKKTCFCIMGESGGEKNSFTFQGPCFGLLYEYTAAKRKRIDVDARLWSLPLVRFSRSPMGHGRAHGVQGNVRLARYMYKCIHVVSRFVRCRVRSIWYGTLVSCDVRR